MAAVNRHYILTLALRIIINRRRRRRIANDVFPNSNKRRSPCFGVRDVFKERDEFGCYTILFEKLEENDREMFFRYITCLLILFFYKN